MDYLKAFIVGGLICAVGQILIDKTKLTPARILVTFVVAGVFLQLIKIYQPLVDFANHVSNTDNLIDMNAMAKLAADEHFKIGRTRLFRWLKYMGVLMANNLPYQQFIDRGYFAVKESVFEVDGMKKTYQQTLVTGKGQRFVINLLKKYYGKEVLQ